MYINNNPVNGIDSTGHCIDGVNTAICIAMAAGAIAGYAIQVGENRAQGMDWGAALTTNISGEKILAGAVIGGGVIIAAAAASVGIAAVGAVGAAACADGDCTNEAQTIGSVGDDILQTVSSINPTGGRVNCVNCAIATDTTLAGYPTSALPGGPFSKADTIDILRQNYDPTKVQQAFSSVMTSANIESQLEAAGPGSRGLVFANPTLQQSSGHAFNAINLNGVVNFIDGQSGRFVNTNLWRNFHFMQTK